MADRSARIEGAPAGSVVPDDAPGRETQADRSPAAGLPAVRPGSAEPAGAKLLVRCLGCHDDSMVEAIERTAAKEIVRILCPKCGKATIATLLVDPDTGTEIDLAAEARRIFAEDLAPVVRITAPDPPTLEELGLRPPTGNPPDEPPLGTPMEGTTIPDPPTDHVQEAYEAWIATEDGRAVAKAIRDRALELRRRGWSTYGIQAIAEVVRFDHALRVGPDAAGYRVNNSHLSRLSRDLMTHYPDLADFFEVRELRTG